MVRAHQYEDSSHKHLLVVGLYLSDCAYAARRHSRPRLSEGEGINFPRKTLPKTQAANSVSSILIQNLDLFINISFFHSYMYMYVLKQFYLNTLKDH